MATIVMHIVPNLLTILAKEMSIILQIQTGFMLQRLAVHVGGAAPSAGLETIPKLVLIWDLKILASHAQIF